MKELLPVFYSILSTSAMFHFFPAGPAISAAPDKWTSVVIRAVHLSMAETPQYFSSESRTASSAALRETWPEIV
jgi:hypothetical protein